MVSLYDQQAGEVPWEADCRDRVMRDYDVLLIPVCIGILVQIA